MLALSLGKKGGGISFLTLAEGYIRGLWSIHVGPLALASVRLVKYVIRLNYPPLHRWLFVARLGITICHSSYIAFYGNMWNSISDNSRWKTKCHFLMFFNIFWTFLSELCGFAIILLYANGVGLLGSNREIEWDSVVNSIFITSNKPTILAYYRIHTCFPPKISWKSVLLGQP